MSKITVEITAQSFELIRDKIAAIITSELAGQFAITANALFQSVVYTERFIAFDKTELPAVKVYFDKAEGIERSPEQSRADYYYNIEVHTAAKFTATDRGDKLASLACEKLLGVIRYILVNPNYLRLDLSDYNIIQSTAIESIKMGNPTTSADGISSIAGLITLVVRANEPNGKLTSVAMGGADSVMGDTLISINN